MKKITKNPDEFLLIDKLEDIFKNIYIKNLFKVLLRLMSFILLFSIPILTIWYTIFSKNNGFKLVIMLFCFCYWLFISVDICFSVKDNKNTCTNYTTLEQDIINSFKKRNIEVKELSKKK